MQWKIFCTSSCLGIDQSLHDTQLIESVANILFCELMLANLISTKDKASLEQDQVNLEEGNGQALLQGFQEGNMSMSMEGKQEAESREDSI